MQQVIPVLTNQIADPQGGTKINAMIHRRIKAPAPGPIAVVQHLGETPRLHAGKIGGHAEFWQTAAEMGLHPFGTRKMLAVDHMEHSEVDRASLNVARGDHNWDLRCVEM